MTKPSRFTIRLAVASVFVLVPGASLADPPGILISPAPHRHFLDTPNGNRVSIGPDVCANPDLQQAFNQFHYNIHGSGSSPTTPIETLGPQDGAPGLHNDFGADMTALRGCG